MVLYGVGEDGFEPYSLKLRRIPQIYSPIALWHFDGSMLDAVSGISLPTGGTNVPTFVDANRGFKVWWSCEIFRPRSAIVSSLQLLGDMTIVMTLMLPTMDTLDIGDEYSSPLNYAILSMCGTTNSSAYNILYALVWYARKLRWWQESGSGVDAIWDSNYVPPRMQWISLAVTRAAGVVSIWENAVLKDSSPVLTTPTGGTSSYLNLAAGPKEPGVNRYINMQCGGLGIYGSALAQSQLDAIATEVLG